MRLYLSILLLSLSLTMLSLIIPMTSPLFTVVTGIGCGGVASVIVAWLIEVENCREKGEKSKAIYGIPWASLTLFVYSYATMYQELYGERLNIDSEKPKHTWIEWKDMLVSALNETPDDDASEKLRRLFDLSSKEAVEQIRFISHHRSQLMADGLLSAEMFQSLHNICQEIELCETMIKHGTCKDIAYFLTSLGASLASFFKQDDVLKHYNEISFYDLVDFVNESEKKADCN